MQNFYTFASEIIIVVAFIFGYRLGKNGNILTDTEVDTLKKLNPFKKKTKVFNSSLDNDSIDKWIEDQNSTAGNTNKDLEF